MRFDGSKNLAKGEPTAPIPPFFQSTMVEILGADRMDRGMSLRISYLENNRQGEDATFFHHKNVVNSNINDWHGPDIDNSS